MLIRIAADVEENLKPVTPLYPTLGGGFALLRYKLDETWDAEGKANRPFNKGTSQLTRFSFALLDIERERQKQRGILKVRSVKTQYVSFKRDQIG